MRLGRWILVPACLLVWALSAQETPSLFQLWLPDFSDSPFPGGKSVIELPDRPIQRLNIVIKEAQTRNLTPGHYRIFVNGKGLGNVFEERATEDGTLLVMDPQTLRKRPDEIFDPRENAVEVMGRDRRGRVYYQNWVLRVNEDQNPEFAYSSIISSEDPKGLPPDLVITDPSEPVKLNTNQPMQVTIKGRLSSGATLTVDGRTAVPAQVALIVPFEYTATVTPRQHEVVLQASDAKGNKREVRIPVYGPKPAAPHPHFIGQKYAILIGVSQFGPGKEAPPPIPLAAADVQELASALQKQAGFKHENMRVLLNDQARPESVRVALTEFASKAQSSDMLLIYLATHGIHDPRPNRGDHLYFALSGTQIVTLDSTALALDDLELFLSRSVRTDQAFLVFDVGHELNDEWRFRAGQNLVNTYVLNLFNDKTSWSLLVSGSSGQTSQEHKGSGPPSSLFSYWLSQGLSGAADLNGDQVVTAKELFAFVSEKVKQESGGTQLPRFRVSQAAADEELMSSR
jgi:Caspase domain